MIAFSPRAELARAHLLREYNLFDVYVEDSSSQNTYIRLINRILGQSGAISNVFPLNGRKNVIAACRRCQHDTTRPRLYLIDGDQDIIIGRQRPKLRHLYRLNVYCMENLLLSEHALVMIAQEGLTNEIWSDVALKLDVKRLMVESVRLLMPLFVLYAIIYKFDLSVETVAFSVRRLLDDPSDPFSLSPKRIASRMRQLVREIRVQVPAAAYKSAKRRIVRRIRRDGTNLSHLISAKTYLLPLLHLRLIQVAGIRDGLDGIKVRLAQHCEIDIDPLLPSAIRAAAAGE